MEVKKMLGLLFGIFFLDGLFLLAAASNVHHYSFIVRIVYVYGSCMSIFLHTLKLTVKIIAAEGDELYKTMFRKADAHRK